MRRRDFLKGSAAALLAPSALTRLACAAAKPPNVLWIMSDQHRADVAGFAGNGLASTPHLDRLASEGTRITELYCQSPVCVPARQSILTGVHPHTHGCFQNQDVAPIGRRTVAHDLADAGYTTALIGKAHCITSGFDVVREMVELREEFSLANPGARRPGEYLVEGFRKRERTTAMFMNEVYRGAGAEPVFFMEQAVVDETRRFLAERSRERPFFAWVSFLSPHPPLFPPSEFLARFADAEIPLPALETSEPPIPISAFRRRMSGFDPKDRAALLNMTRAYYASVAWMDHCVGEVLDALESSGDADDTLVVYTSDHGELLGERGLVGKRLFYDSPARVPCLLRLPGQIDAGGVSRAVAQHVDLTATLYDIADATPRHPLAGRSLAPVLLGASADWEDRAISEMKEGVFDAADPPSGERPVVEDPSLLHHQWMIRVGSYKYSHYEPGFETLYDMREDPGETNNLVARSEHRDRVAFLRERAAQEAPEPWADYQGAGEAESTGINAPLRASPMKRY